MSNPDSISLSSPIVYNVIPTSSHPQMPIQRISVEVFLPSMSWNHLHHGQASIWQSSSCSILNWSSESKNSHKDGCEHKILLRNTPTDIPTQPLSAILLEAFDREIPLRKEWPEKLTTDLCLLKSCKSSDLQKIRREISHSYKLQCRCWHLGYSALTDEFSILLVKEWMQKKKKIPDSYLPPVLISSY